MLTRTRFAGFIKWVRRWLACSCFSLPFVFMFVVNAVAQDSTPTSQPMMLASGHGHHRPPRGPRIIIPLPSFKPSIKLHSEDKIPDIPDVQDYADDPETPKPKPKVVAAPSKDLHPENDGSIQARAFLLKVALGFPPGLAEFVWKDPNGAEKLFATALKEAGNIPYPEGKRAAHKNLAAVYYLKGLFTPAIENYQKALELNTKIGDGENHAMIVNCLAAAMWASGEYESASGYFDEALSTFRDIGAADGEANTRNNLGVLYETQGKLDQAVTQFHRAMAVDRTNLKLRVLACANLGEVYHKQGKYEESEAAYTEALQASKKIRNSKLQAQILINLGLLHREWAGVRRAPQKLGDSAKELLEAFRICHGSAVPTFYPSKLLGDVYLDLADTLRAEPCLKEAGFNSSLGRMYLMRNDQKKAAEHYEKLLNSAKKYNRFEDLMVACIALGKINEASQNLPKAEDYYTKGIEAAETIRSGKLLSERRGFFGTPLEGFSPAEAAKGLTRVKIKRSLGAKKKPDQTIYSTELTRAREFADNLVLNADVTQIGVPKDMLDQEKKLMSRIASLSKARDLMTREQDREAFDKKTKEINEMETKLRDFVETMGKRCPTYAAVRHPKPLELVNSAVGPDEFAVIFDVADEALSVKLIKGKEVLRAACIEWNLDELTRAIAEFRKPFEGHEGSVAPNRLEAFDPKLANELYRRLFADILDAVPEGSPLIIVPDHALGNLPFEALVARGQVSWKKDSGVSYPEGITYLGQLYSVSYYQSVTALTLTRAFPKSGITGDRILAVIDPVFDKGDSRYEASPAVSRPADTPTEPPRLLAVKEDETSSETAGNVASLRSSDEPERTMAPSKALRRKAKVESTVAPTTVSAPAVAPDMAPSTAAAQLAFTQEFCWPRLKLTAQLGDTLRNVFSEHMDLCSDMQAGKSLVLSRPLNRYRSIVFGTHGYFGQDIPGVMEPVLVLSIGSQETDKYLRMSEVTGLDLTADMVVLAACQTGLGNYQVGEGIISMGRAFQYAGARSVLITLWTVPEAASVALVDSFLTHLKRGENKAVALSMARNELRTKHKRYAHPFYWAPFILVGESWPVPERIKLEAAERFLKASSKNPRVQPASEQRRQRTEEEE
jgi:CHAT domain-containing protein/Tfp pilus assembly protein PilF